MTSSNKSAAYTQLWYLAQADEQGFKYYKGLSDEERQQLSDFATEALGIERRLMGVPPVINEESVTKDLVEVTQNLGATPPLNQVHNPKHYSFDEQRLWIPWALDAPTGPYRGIYPKKYPIGALIHFTAGHRNGLTAGNKLMRDTGMSYLLIDQDGNVAQSNPLNQHGYHGGASSWPGISGNVSDDLVGIEIQCAGKLTEHQGHYYPWWDEGKRLVSNRIPPEEVTYMPKLDNVQAGYYHLYTEAQMYALRKLICWLHLNHPNVFQLKYVLGHDEVAPNRKNDPGGSLGMTMPKFRELIQRDVETIKSLR